MFFLGIVCLGGGFFLLFLGRDGEGNDEYLQRHGHVLHTVEGVWTAFSVFKAEY